LMMDRHDRYGLDWHRRSPSQAEFRQNLQAYASQNSDLARPRSVENQIGNDDVLQDLNLTFEHSNPFGASAPTMSSYNRRTSKPTWQDKSGRNKKQWVELKSSLDSRLYFAEERLIQLLRRPPKRKCLSCMSLLSVPKIKHSQSGMKSVGTMTDVGDTVMISRARLKELSDLEKRMPEKSPLLEVWKEEVRRLNTQLATLQQKLGASEARELNLVQKLKSMSIKHSKDQEELSRLKTELAELQQTFSSHKVSTHFKTAIKRVGPRDSRRTKDSSAQCNIIKIVPKADKETQWDFTPELNPAPVPKAMPQKAASSKSKKSFVPRTPFHKNVKKRNKKRDNVFSLSQVCQIVYDLWEKKMIADNIDGNFKLTMDK